MSDAKVQAYAGTLEASFAETLRVAGMVPEANRCLQLEEGRVQPTWLLGHLANTLNIVVGMWMFENESAMPKGWGRTFAPDFAGGNPVTCNPSDYPPYNEVVGAYRSMTEKIVPQIRGLQDAVLPDPLPGKVPEALRAYFSSYESVLQTMIMHDSYHRGQLGLLAKLRQPA